VHLAFLGHPDPQSELLRVISDWNQNDATYEEVFVVNRAGVGRCLDARRTLGLRYIEVRIWPPERHIWQAVMSLATGRATVVHGGGV
jgi:hypothetical protein